MARASRPGSLGGIVRKVAFFPHVVKRLRRRNQPFAGATGFSAHYCALASGSETGVMMVREVVDRQPLPVDRDRWARPRTPALIPGHFSKKSGPLLVRSAGGASAKTIRAITSSASTAT